MFNSLKLYSVYQKPDAEDEADSLVFIRDGFSWGAFIFGAIWALYRKVWWLTVAWIMWFFASSYLAENEKITSETLLGISLAIQFYLGFSANDWWEASLIRKGYVFKGVTSGTSEGESERRFFDTRYETI